MYTKTNSMHNSRDFLLYWYKILGKINVVIKKLKFYEENLQKTRCL